MLQDSKKIVEQITDKILAMPNPTMFIAKFSAIDKASTTLKRLSFVKVDSIGMLIPKHIQIIQWPTDEGAFVILGGSLSEDERLEVFELFNKEGWIDSIALPHGARPLPLSKPPREKTKQIQKPVGGKSKDIYEILMDAICCVMCADGNTTPKEREAIRIILGKTKAPWTKEDIDKRIGLFLERAKVEGMDKIVETTCKNLPEFKRRKKQEVLTVCLDFIARADGMTDENEKKLIEKFKSAIGTGSTDSGGRLPLAAVPASARKEKSKEEDADSLVSQDKMKTSDSPLPVVTEWYYVENASKHVHQLVLKLPPGSEVPPRVKGTLVSGRMGELMKRDVAGLVLFLEGGGKEEKGPFIFVKANNVVHFLKGYEARIAFAFYRFPTGGVLQIFVTVLSPKVKTKSGCPFIAENVHWPDGNDSKELIPALLNRDFIEVCFIADGLDGPLHGYFGLRAKIPEDCKAALKKEWESITSYHTGLSPSKINRAAAMAQFEKENPLEENPVLKGGLLAKLKNVIFKLVNLKKSKTKAITREQQEALWLRSMELWAAGHDRAKVKVITIDESGAKTLGTSPEAARWAAPILEMVSKADNLAKQGKYIEAINAYKQVLAEAPNAAIALMSIGSCYGFMGDKANAIKWMRKAKSADPNNKRVIENLQVAERM